MKSIKKIVALSFVFVMFSCFVSWAGTKHVTTDEYDPRNMTWEERAEWVDANVPKTHYEARSIIQRKFRVVTYRGDIFRCRNSPIYNWNYENQGKICC